MKNWNYKMENIVQHTKFLWKRKSMDINTKRGIFGLEESRLVYHVSTK